MIQDTDQNDDKADIEVAVANLAADGKRIHHVVLTKRDLDLMVDLHDHVVLSFAQIHEKYFADRTNATAMNRLKRIEAHGWIARFKVPRLHVHGRTNATGVVFQLSGKGRSVLSKHRPELEVFEKCPTLNLYQLDHDLLIGDIASHFRSQYPTYQWINGRYLMDLDGIRKIPDAVLKNPSTGKVIAIELELNGKSSRRYADIVTNLRSSVRIEKVIFVTASTTIGRKIMSEIEGFSVPIGHRFRSDFFEFVRLTDCLPKPVHSSAMAAETPT